MFCEQQNDVDGSEAPSPGDLTTVLGGVKGALAALGGCAALDPACAPWLVALVDGARIGASCLGSVSLSRLCRAPSCGVEAALQPTDIVQ